jgi:hypothetical protein
MVADMSHASRKRDGDPDFGPDPMARNDEP